ncbi:hypothetical protein SAMN05444050_0506 [Afipia sp. GAS231]|nr:hypothetical protein SAMN05444050_0506 [Afipia sp. GAS231]
MAQQPFTGACCGNRSQSTGYVTGPPRHLRARADKFITVLVYCVGPANPRTTQACCHHRGRLRLEELPEWDGTMSPRTSGVPRCGTVGYVDAGLDWSEVININKGIG